jgi:hypothetical protein
VTHRYHQFVATLDPRYQKCAYCEEQRRVPTPREEGAAAGSAALSTAQRVTTFNGSAVRQFFLNYLAAHRQATGEDLTDAAKRAGHIPHDDRAFGPIFASLARAGAIRVLDFSERRKGHGTAGARVWQIR